MESADSEQTPSTYATIFLFVFFCFFHLRLTYPDISRSFSFLYMYRFRVKNVKCGRVGVLTFSVYRKRAAAKTFRKIENF